MNYQFTQLCSQKCQVGKDTISAFTRYSPGFPSVQGSRPCRVPDRAGFPTNYIKCYIQLSINSTFPTMQGSRPCRVPDHAAFPTTLYGQIKVTVGNSRLPDHSAFPTTQYKLNLLREIRRTVYNKFYNVLPAAKQFTTHFGLYFKY